MAYKVMMVDVEGHGREVLEIDKIHEDGHEGRWLIFWNEQDGERLRVRSNTVAEVSRVD